MNSGIYTAYSGMQAQLDALDLVANNLANVNTTGFKEEKAFFEFMLQASSSEFKENPLQESINAPVTVKGSLNVEDGSLTHTYRDLDVAIEGKGFLVVETPRGIRYTRNGSLLINKDGTLSTSDGSPVLGEKNKPITLGPGQISIGENGEVQLNGVHVNKIKVVRFENLSALEKEGSSLFMSRTDQGGELESDAKIRSGYLEKSNVNPVESVIKMVSILRNFESLQKCMSNLSNDMDSKAIDKLSR